MTKTQLLIKNALIPVTEEKQAGNVRRTTLSCYKVVNVLIDLISGCFLNPSEQTQNQEEELEEIDGTDCLLLPGFVDCHAHSSEHWLRGACGLYPLELWLDPLIRFSPLSPQTIQLSAQATAVDLLLSGSTCVLDHIFVPPGRMDLIDAAVLGFKQVGIRLFLAPMIADKPSIGSHNFPHFGEISTDQTLKLAEDWAAPVKETIDFLESVIAKHHKPQEGVSIVIAPSGVQWCSTEMLKALHNLAVKHNLPMHTHLVETFFQKTLASERNDGNGPSETSAKFLQRIGCIGQVPFSFAHCVHLTQNDIQLFASNKEKVSVVHNPQSNLRLGSGISPILDIRDSQINIAFGTDGASSNDAQNFLEVMKLACILHSPSTTDYQRWLQPIEVLKMATINGAKAIGCESKLGSITVGKLADFTLFDLHSLSMLPRTDPLSLLILGRPDKDAVKGVWVAGKRVVENGRILNIDLRSLCSGLWNKTTFPALAPQLLQPLPEYEQQYQEALKRKQNHQNR